MRGNTQKARNNYYKTHYCKAKRMTRYLYKLIHTHKHWTNFQILDDVLRTHPEFDEITWDFVQLTRAFKYARYSETDLHTQLLHHGLIKEEDLHLRRRK